LFTVSSLCAGVASVLAQRRAGTLGQYDASSLIDTQRRIGGATS